MAENRVKDFTNTLDLVQEQMVQKEELSTISVAVELEGLDQVNEELDKMLIKLEKANSSANELASKVKADSDELKVLAKPLQEYLTSNFNPMCSVVVDVDRVTVVSKELSTPTD